MPSNTNRVSSSSHPPHVAIGLAHLGIGNSSLGEEKEESEIGELHLWFLTKPTNSMLGMMSTTCPRGPGAVMDDPKGPI